jgi:hypothetical protein
VLAKVKVVGASTTLVMTRYDPRGVQIINIDFVSIILSFVLPSVLVLLCL